MSYGPTHQFCPSCSAMLPAHLTECPRCGHNLTSSGLEIGGKDILQITGAILLIAAVPFIILLVAVAICVASAS